MHAPKTLLFAIVLCLPVFQVKASGVVKATTKVVEEAADAVIKHGGSILGKTTKSKASREILEEAAKKYGDDVVEETVEIAAKRSGKTIGKTAEATIGDELIEAMGKYGDDVIPLVREGGLEVLEQGAKHGDDFWRLCKQVPDASRAMALHADELIPLAKRIGPEVLEIEAKAPTMAAKVASEFGDDAVKVLAKHPEDTTRLVGYAAKADSPETARLLYETYKKSANPSAFLEHLNWKHIMAAGLSSAAIISTYQISDGVQEGFKNPETLNHATSLFFLLGAIVLAIVFSPFIIKRFLKCRKLWNEQKQDQLKQLNSNNRRTK